MTIEWDETVETKRRVRMLVDGRGSPSAPAAAVWAPGFRDATIDDLRRACEAAGLTLASAQHAEDLEKLGREMNEVVAQRDEARKERDQYLQACEQQEDKVRDTANEVATLRDRVDGLEIDLNSAVQNSKASEVEANNLRSANRTLRARVAELEAERDDALAALEGGANEGLVAAAQRVAVESHDMRVKELRTLEAAPPCGASPWVNQLSKESVEFWTAVNAFAVASGGRADAVNTARMNAVVRIIDAVNALLVGTPSDATPAPQGQPVATDEELSDLYVHERSLFLEDPDRTGTEARRLAIRAVAERVGRERPQCLIARAVASNIDVRAAEDSGGGFLVGIHRPGEDEDVERNVPAAEVPATLARLLDEVEAARKAVQK